MNPELQINTGLIESSFALLDLARRARHAATARELGFVLVNDSRTLVAYRQAGLWLAAEGVYALSGVVQIEANAPYALWLEQVCHHLAAQPCSGPRSVTAEDLPPALAHDWHEWWPAHALWLPLRAAAAGQEPGNPENPEHPAKADQPAKAAPDAAGLILVREVPWTEQEKALLQEWSDIARHALHALYHPRVSSWRSFSHRVRTHLALRPERPWWRQRVWQWSALVLAILALPVRLTVLAPGELVPAHPLVIRAPLDGVVDVFHVQPNQLVRKAQPLFGFDEALIQSRSDVAAQTLATAETEYRQTSQQALIDPKSRQQLALLIGKIEEKRAEVDYLREQLQRARVLAPEDGVALFDDPSEWIGKPVTVGERIMRIAAPSDSEVEAWLPIADAIALAPQAQVKLYLNASPLAPVAARLRFEAHDAVQRPDGSYAYRVRASLEGATDHRVGLKGTAKVYGGWVPLIYWVLRRPLAAVRATLGW